MTKKLFVSFARFSNKSGGLSFGNADVSTYGQINYEKIEDLQKKLAEKFDGKVVILSWQHYH
jgi:hypothetical protein